MDFIEIFIEKNYLSLNWLLISWQWVTIFNAKISSRHHQKDPGVENGTNGQVQIHQGIVKHPIVHTRLAASQLKEMGITVENIYLP